MVPSPSTYHNFGPRTVGEIQNKVIKQSGRNAASRFFHAKHDKEIIAAWKSELNGILIIFNVCSVPPARISLTVLPLDRVGPEYSYHHYRYPSEYAKTS